MNGILIIINGPSGSGKTKYIKETYKREEVEYFNGDEFVTLLISYLKNFETYGAISFEECLPTRCNTVVIDDIDMVMYLRANTQTAIGKIIINLLTVGKVVIISGIDTFKKCPLFKELLTQLWQGPTEYINL